MPLRDEQVDNKLRKIYCEYHVSERVRNCYASLQRDVDVDEPSLHVCWSGIGLTQSLLYAGDGRENRVILHTALPCATIVG